jgi:magnesium-transporting ATPase (P-type)/class 3 adenylate cyclase
VRWHNVYKAYNSIFAILQFRRAANVYFLVISVLQLSTDLSPTNRFSTILPLALVLSVSLAKEAVEDIKRHVADSIVNATHVNVLRSQAPVSPEWPRIKCCRSRSVLPRLPSQDSRWVSIPSRFLGPGDIIRLRDHDSCPADIVLLSVTNSTGGLGSAAYVETASLDGETNLKTRFPLNGIDKVVTDPSHFASLQGTLECEAPNARLYHFEGRMRIQGLTSTAPPEVISIENSNILLRGMVLRNTARAVGIVVYAGHDTKLMQNSRQAPSKRSHLDRRIDRVVWGLFAVLLIMCLITAGGHGNMTSYHSVGNTWYLPWYTDPNRSAIQEFFQMLGTALVLYNGIVPISLYVTLEIVKFAQARQVDSDPFMTYTGDDNTRRHARARTSNLNESLGQIEYLFSDKTGTLTANQMLLKSICLRGTSFSVEMGPTPVQTGVSRKNLLPASLTGQIRRLRDKALARALLDAGNPLHHQIWEMLLCSAICHTVLPASTDVTDTHYTGDTADIPGNVSYQSASPDEVALVTAACTLGLKLTRRDAQTMTLSILGKEVTFTVVLVNEFSSTRRCMSVLIQRPDGIYVMYAKGADSTLLPRVTVVNPNILESEAAAANVDATASSSMLDEDDRFAGVLESVTDRSTDTGYDPRSTGPDGHLYRNSSFLVGLPMYSPQGLTARTHNDSMKVGLGRSTRDLDSSRAGPSTPFPSPSIAIDTDRLHFPASLFRPWKLTDPVVEANAAEQARREAANKAARASPGSTGAASATQPPVLSLPTASVRPGPRISLPGRTIQLSSPLPDRPDMSPTTVVSMPSAYSLVAQGSESGLTLNTPAVRPVQAVEDPLAQMQDNLDDFASVGLRTLVFARRVLDPRTAARFIAIHREASLKVLSREDALQRVANEMEQRLELLGASGIEDKLQEQVPETIRKLADAGCNVWMLTGDKTETAISIGLSCKLLHEEMDTLVLRAGALDSNMAALSAAKAALEKAGKWRPDTTNNNLAVIIEGTALHELLPLSADKVSSRGWTPFSGSGSKGTVSQEQDADAFETSPNHALQAIPSVAKMQAAQAREYLDYSKRSLLEVLLQSKCVIACRVSPLQKAQLVRMVRSSPKAPICAAVGDGANDVSMIQEADIGIGVEGKEGTQAVNVSDFSIARFHFLQRLLFVHGRNNYNRITTVILYSVCKNIAPVTVLFIFSFFDMFSGTTLFESYLGAAYNVVFTSIPIILVGIWDKDVSDGMAVKYPEVYKAGQRNDRFSVRQITSWLAVGVLCACAVAVFGGGALLYTPTDSAGLNSPLLGLGACMHFMIVACINVLLALEVYSWNWRIAAALLGSILSWVVFLVVYASLYNVWSEATLLDVAGLWYIVLTNLPFWFAVPIVLAVVSMPTVIFSWWRRIVSPTSLTMIQEWDRGLAAPFRLLQRPQFSDTQSTALRHSGEGARSEGVLANRASAGGNEPALRDGSAFLPLYKLVGRRTAMRPTPRKSVGSGIMSPVVGLTPKMDGADFDAQLHTLSKMINDAHTVISRRRKRFLKSLERRPSGVSHRGVESPMPSPIATPVLRSELSMVPILTPGTPVGPNTLQSPSRRSKKSVRGSTWLRAFQTHEPDALIKKKHRAISMFLGARPTNSTDEQDIQDPSVPGGANVSVNRTAVTVSDGNANQGNAVVRYNPCTQQFDDPSAENRFMNIFVRKATRGTRIALLLAWFFAIGYAAATYHDSSLVANGIRLALICVALMFILFTLTQSFRMYYSLSMCLALFLAGLAKTAAIDAGGEFGQTLFQLGVLLLVRLRPIHTLTICIIDLIIYIIFTVDRGHTDMLPQFLVYIAFVTSFAGAGAYFLHSAMRHDHLEQSRMFLAERKGAELLTNMLPSHVIAVLRQTQGKAVNTISFAEPAISVLFIDICGFYHLVAQHTPNSLVDLMDRFFSLLDTLAEKHGVMKYETVSKSYVAVCGLQGDTEEHTAVLALFGLDVLRHLSMLQTKDGQQALTVRMGLHTGPVVTGIVGRKRPQFCLVGDTVNTAART